MEVSPIKIFDPETSKFKTAPVDAEGKINNDKAKKKIMEFLQTRDVDLSEHSPKEWDDEMRGKVDNIFTILAGHDVSLATSTAKNPDKTTATEASNRFYQSR